MILEEPVRHAWVGTWGLACMVLWSALLPRAAVGQDLRTLQTTCAGKRVTAPSIPPYAPETQAEAAGSIREILRTVPTWSALPEESWTRMKGLWNADSLGTEWGLASVITDVQGSSEEEALMSSEFYRVLSGRIFPLLVELDLGGDESRRYFALESVTQASDSADQAAVVAFACESAVMLLFGQQMVQAGGLAKDVALHARWRKRESRVLREALRLSDIRNRPLVQDLCDKWCLAE